MRQHLSIKQILTIAFLILFGVGGLIMSTAQQPLRAQGVDTARWQAEYWNNATLAGPPVVTRTEESAPNYNWGQGSPEGIPFANDRFSARWRTTLDLPAGEYRFSVTADDGVRLWVDGEQLIDAWTVQSAEQFAARTTLDGGEVPIRLDYFENTGVAEVQLSWERVNGTAPVAPLPTADSAVGAPVNFWRGEYYRDVNLQQLAFERNDNNLNFDWGLGSPNPDVLAPDRFSARWTRTLVLEPGRYLFTATADDGVRVWVNEQLVLNHWVIQAAQTYETVVDITGGPTPVRVEYFEHTGVASIQVTWREAGAATPTPIPVVIPDNDEQPLATMTGARYLNVRRGPGIQYQRLAIIPNGEVVEYLGRTPAGIWVQIQLNDGRVGWANSRYFTSDTAVINLPVVAR